MTIGVISNLSNASDDRFGDAFDNDEATVGCTVTY